jgi:hypothetical protein
VNIEEAVRRIGMQFNGRLDANVLQSALDYVDFGESRLAVEMLCDQLLDFDVPISKVEFQELELVAAATQADMDRIESLRSLVANLNGEGGNIG